MSNCCKYKINDFSKRLVIQRLTHGQDANGWDNTTVATYATVWGIIEPLKSHEKLQSMQLSFSTTHKIIIRYNATNIAITTKDRIKYGDRYFNIQGIINIDEDDKFIRLDVQETQEAST